VVSHEDKKFAESNVIGADSTIFKVFTIPFIAGDPATALREPNAIVITRSMAAKYFGDKDPMGQTLHFDHFFSDCKVTGVVEDYPENSHLKFGVILSLSTLKAIHFNFENWSNHTFSTYVVLHDQAEVKNVEEKMPRFLRANLGPFFMDRFQKSYDEMYKEGDHYNLFLVPLGDIHLSAMLDENQEGKHTMVYALAFIGLIIIVLVCINYTNLATVISFGRAREAGIRKAAGCRSDSLFRQFMTESILIAFVGLALGIGLAEVFLPFFNSLIHHSLQLNYTNPVVGATLIAFTLLVGLFSGLYPAMTFASFNPVHALKGNPGTKGNRPWLRNGLVIFQFTVCIVMIVSTIVVYKQLTFMTGKALGFSKNQILVVKRPEGLKEHKTAFKSELLKLNSIHSVSYSETTPGRHFNGHGQHLAGTAPTDIPVIFPLVADQDILETLDLKIVQGTSFKAREGKLPKAILNEAAVAQLKLQDPMAAKIDRGTMGEQAVDVVGVVADFHFKSFHHKVEPLVIYSMDIENDPQHRASYILIRIDGAQVAAALKVIESTWRNLAGNYPFEYSFLDEDFDRLFEREETMSKAYTTFSGIAICIACLGLLGLTSYFTSKRTKEIGIRKIVGASLPGIAILLSRDFLKLLLISIVIGSVGAWYMMDQWLQRFAYQTEMSWWIFFVAGGAMIFISLATVSGHLYTAASRNPVETLRYE
jgi:putative ABC transport system permease protein